MAEAKHAFVDDNPYLVYSPIAETTSEGGSGGSGGSGGVFKIEFEEDITEGIVANKTLSEIIEAYESGMNLIGLMNAGYDNWFVLQLTSICTAADNEYVSFSRVNIGNKIVGIQTLSISANGITFDESQGTLSEG